MKLRTWACVIFYFIATSLLLTSCNPKYLKITSITHYPILLEEGGTINYFVNYKNLSADETLNDVTLEVEFPEYFIHPYSELSFVQPIRETRVLLWELGSLQPGQSSSVSFSFVIDHVIPVEIFSPSITESWLE